MPSQLHRQRQMTLIGFVQARNCSAFPGSWRHAAAAQDFMSPEYYQQIARILEEGQIPFGVLRRPLCDA
jgi:hypothetical protein